MVIKDYKWNTKLDIVCVKMVHEMGLMDITETREIPINYYSKIFTQKRTYSTTILRGIIMTIHIKLKQSAKSYLLYLWQEIVWDVLWIFTNSTTLMRPNRIEVTESYNFPIWLRLLNISSNFFKEKL